MNTRILSLSVASAALLGLAACNSPEAEKAPAEATGLADRGTLREGLRADVIRVARIGRAAALRGVWVAGHRVG